MVFPQWGGVCNNPWLIFHVNKNKIKVMRHIFQYEWWGNIVVGITYGLIMAMEIGKVKKEIIGF